MIDEVCNALSGRCQMGAARARFTCSLPKGHDGDHEAWYSNRQLDSWPQATTEQQNEA